MRRLTSILLCLTLTAFSAGAAPYAAWGQVRVEAVPADAGLPGAGAAALAIAGLHAPGLTLPQTSLLPALTLPAPTRLGAQAAASLSG
ncbi:MAG: hypothetical protein KGL53_15015, partial [Elusimicrobia bacterium]|nr:hypothetical protein [Elusimicrobiota bacterium]